VLGRRSEPAALQGDQGKLHSACTGRGAAWLARQSGGLEVPGSSPGAPMRGKAAWQAAFLVSAVVRVMT
jgi:hypothetical protein